MDTLQQSLNQVLEGAPAILLQKLIDKKLQKQGIPPSKDLSKKLALHILSKTGKPFRYRSRKYSGHIISGLLKRMPMKYQKRLIASLRSNFPSYYRR